MLWLLTARIQTMECQGSQCSTLPGTSTVHLVVTTLPSQETCEQMRQQMQATSTVEAQRPGGRIVRQHTTYGCQRGE